MLDKLLKVRNKVRSKKGFTLVELLVVVAIIAILVAIAIPMYGAQLNEAKLQVDNSTVRTAESMAIADYYLKGDNDGETYYLGQDNNSVKSTYYLDTKKPPRGYNQAKQGSHEKGKAYVQVIIDNKGKVTSATWVA